MKKLLFPLLLSLLLTSCELLFPEAKGDVYYVSAALNYENTHAALKGTINDQIAMDAQIEYSAQQTDTVLKKYSIREQDGIKTLTDNTSKEKFSENFSSTLKQTLADITSEANEEDIIIFYYSGHGASKKINKVPDGSLIFSFNGDGTVTDYLSPEELFSICDKAKAKILLIIDSCYSGNFSVDNRPDSSWQEAISTFFNVDGFSNIWVLAAAREDEESFEATGHGYFTSVILEGLGYNAAKESYQDSELIVSGAVGYNKRVSFTELSDAARRKVPSLYYKQHPQSSLSFADLVIF